jgi:hypothetical protein
MWVMRVWICSDVNSFAVTQHNSQSRILEFFCLAASYRENGNHSHHTNPQVSEIPDDNSRFRSPTVENGGWLNWAEKDGWGVARYTKI